ncbi:unnamed protein product [Caenorhabditis sp. 36 PRJEB53466]|nr:unnamed protein product [Caenorhabditis sp. 36 PRJEB53466]
MSENYDRRIDSPEKKNVQVEDNVPEKIVDEILNKSAEEDAVLDDVVDEQIILERELDLKEDDEAKQTDVEERILVEEGSGIKPQDTVGNLQEVLDKVLTESTQKASTSVIPAKRARIDECDDTPDAPKRSKQLREEIVDIPMRDLLTCKIRRQIVRKLSQDMTARESDKDWDTPIRIKLIFTDPNNFKALYHSLCTIQYRKAFDANTTVSTNRKTIPPYILERCLIQMSTETRRSMAQYSEEELSLAFFNYLERRFSSDEVNLMRENKAARDGEYQKLVDEKLAQPKTRGRTEQAFFYIFLLPLGIRQLYLEGLHLHRWPVGQAFYRDVFDASMTDPEKAHSLLSTYDQNKKGCQERLRKTMRQVAEPTKAARKSKITEDHLNQFTAYHDLWNPSTIVHYQIAKEIVRDLQQF